MFKKFIALFVCFSLCFTVSVFAEISETKGVYKYSFSDDFNSYTANVLAHGQGKTLSENWRGKTSEEGYMGGTAELYTNESKFGFDGSAIKIYGSSVSPSYNYRLRYNLSNCISMPAVIFDVPEDAPKQKQVIRFSVRKTHAAHTFAFRFMVHKNSETNTFDGYTLWLPGMYSSGNVWSLYKDAGGTVTEVANGGEANTSSGTNGGGDKATGYIGVKTSYVTIIYDSGKISFEISCLSGTENAYTLSGSYTDANPFQIADSQKSTAVWLMTGAMQNETRDRYVLYDDFSYESSKDIPEAEIFCESESEPGTYSKIENGVLTLKAGQEKKLCMLLGEEDISDKCMWSVTDGITGVWVSENGLLKSDSAVKDVVVSAVYTDESGNMQEASITVETLLREADFVLKNKNDNLFVNIASLDCASLNCKGYIVYYNKNHSMSSVSEHDVSFDSSGNAQISAKYALCEGGTVRILLLEDLKSLNPLVKIKEFDVTEILLEN